MKTKSVLSGADQLLGSYIISQGRETRKKEMKEGREGYREERRREGNEIRRKKKG